MPKFREHTQYSLGDVYMASIPEQRYVQDRYTFRKTIDRQEQKDREWFRRTSRSSTEAFENRSGEERRESPIESMWLPVGMMGIVFIAMSV